MSTTPRTDDAKEQYLTGKMGIYGVLDEARKLETELVAMQARAEKAVADTARLDWLGKSSFAKFYEGPCVWRINGDEKTDGDTLRDSIDAAMKEAEAKQLINKYVNT